MRTRGIGLPRCGRAAVDVTRTPGQAVELGVAESLGDPLEQPRRVRRSRRRETRRAPPRRARRPALRARESPGCERTCTSSGAASEQRLGDALVVVLVDDDHAHPRVALRLERVEEALELLGSTHRRDDEVERRRAPATRAVGYGTLPTAPARHRAPRRSRRRGRTSEPRSRAFSARRSPDLEVVVVDDASTDATPEILASIGDRAAARGPQRRAAWPRRLAEPRARRRSRDATSHASTPTTWRMPRRLERQLARIRSGAAGRHRRIGRPRARRAGRVGTLHAMPVGACRRAVGRTLQLALLPSDRARRPRRPRRVMRSATTRASRRARTTSSGRACSAVADGDNVPDPLVLYRVASRAGVATAARAPARVPAARRATDDRRGSRRICPRSEAELAWRVGVAEQVPERDEVEAAVDAYLASARRVRATRGAGRPRAGGARPRAARRQCIGTGAAHESPRQALRLDPGLPAHVVAGGARARDAGSRTPGRGRGLAVRGSPADDAAGARSRCGGLPGADAVSGTAARPDRRVTPRST